MMFEIWRSGNGGRGSSSLVGHSSGVLPDVGLAELTISFCAVTIGVRYELK